MQVFPPRVLPTLLLTTTLAQAVSGQTFTRRSDLLANPSGRSGGCVGVADMDGDGFDDIIRLHQSRTVQIEYGSAAGTFTQHAYGAMATTAQWGFAVGDTDHDGHKDLVSGGSGQSGHFLSIDARGVSALSQLDQGVMFMQCMNMVDVDNDGWLDVFGCHDDAAPRIWLNNGSGAVSYNNYINFATDPTSDMSGNYGSVWTDFDNDGDVDLFIAKCRQGVTNSADPRRWNRLFVRDASNQYSDQALAFGMQSREQSWTTDFGDIDNDGDLDAVITNHSTTMQVFLNDGTGHFTNATAGSGLAITASFLQAKLEDLDNDGFLDLITAGNLGGPGAEYYFHGNGNGTFTSMPNMLPEPAAGYILHSFALGDLDHNGTIDVYASYGNGYVGYSSTLNDQLYLNNGNTNHFLNFDLRGVQSNRDGVGARVTLYGPWGTQIREIRAGESYGMVCSFTAHFGLGAQLEADSAVIRWPSGTVDRIRRPAADQWIHVTEGETRTALVAVDVLLDGPYVAATGLMGDALRVNGRIPEVEPYTALGYTAVGDHIRKVAPSVLAMTGNDAIVDWVWLELRTGSGAATVLRSRPALLQRDGDVVELDGRREVAMGLADDSYRVVVRHRNHLGVMTASAYALSATPTAVDLTSNATATWGTDARRTVGTRMTLWSGNVLSDNQIKYTGGGNDRDLILQAIGGTVPTATVNGYLAGDVNLDGTVKYTGGGNDRDPVLLSVGGTVPTNTRMEQLP
ncbi:MAG TPA: CRTAC1 family protein [Flavobacteriales bacterium]